jgi:hypothetical protein
VIEACERRPQRITGVRKIFSGPRQTLQRLCHNRRSGVAGRTHDHCGQVSLLSPAVPSTERHESGMPPTGELMPHYELADPGLDGGIRSIGELASRHLQRSGDHDPVGMLEAPKDQLGQIGHRRLCDGESPKRRGYDAGIRVPRCKMHEHWTLLRISHDLGGQDATRDRRCDSRSGLVLHG